MNALDVLGIALSATEPGYEPHRNPEFFDRLCARLRQRPHVLFQNRYKVACKGLAAAPRPGMNSRYYLDFFLAPERDNVHGREHHYRVADVPMRERGKATFPLYRLYRVSVGNSEVFLCTLNLSQPVASPAALLKLAVSAIFADISKTATAATEPKPGLDRTSPSDLGEYLRKQLRGVPYHGDLSAFSFTVGPKAGDVYPLRADVMWNGDDTYVIVNMVDHYLRTFWIHDDSDISAVVRTCKSVVADVIKAARASDSIAAFHSALEQIGRRERDQDKDQTHRNRFSIRFDPGNQLTYYGDLKALLQRLRGGPVTAAAELYQGTVNAEMAMTKITEKYGHRLTNFSLRYPFHSEDVWATPVLVTVDGVTVRAGTAHGVLVLALEYKVKDLRVRRLFEAHAVDGDSNTVHIEQLQDTPGAKSPRMSVDVDAVDPVAGTVKNIVRKCVAAMSAAQLGSVDSFQSIRDAVEAATTISHKSTELTLNPHNPKLLRIRFRYPGGAWTQYESVGLGSIATEATIQYGTPASGHSLSGFVGGVTAFLDQADAVWQRELAHTAEAAAEPPAKQAPVSPNQAMLDLVEVVHGRGVLEFRNGEYTAMLRPVTGEHAPWLKISCPRWATSGRHYFECRFGMSRSARGTYPKLMDANSNVLLVGNIHENVSSWKDLLRNAIKLAIRLGEVEHKHAMRAQKQRHAEAATEPQPQVHGIAGVLQRLRQRLGGKVSDSRLSLTPYLYIDVDAGPTSYTEGFVDICVRFAGYAAYVAVLDLNDAEHTGTVFDAVHRAVKIVLGHAAETAKAQPDLDRFSVALGMGLQKLQYQSIDTAAEDGRAPGIVRTRYDQIWNPKRKAEQRPQWRALEVAYTSLKGRA